MRKHYKNRFTSINEIDKSKLSEKQLEEYGFIRTLALSNDRRVIHEIESVEQLSLFNNHFRAGLSVLYNENKNFKVKYECIGIYGGLAQFGRGKTTKKMILKNVYLGNMYVADHCFVSEVYGKVPENIKFGDLILFTCYIVKYTDSNNMPNFALCMCGDGEIYNPTKFNKELLPLVKEEKKEEYKDKRYQIQSVKFKSLINAIVTSMDLPERFVETFTLSILTGKCREADLMKGLDHLSIIDNKYENFVCHIYKKVIEYIINDDINFGILQAIILQSIDNYFGVSMEKRDFEISFTDDRNIFNDNMDTLKEELIIFKISID